ncbi:ester cyclase [Streptomyces griseus]|uniref:ester cyclase n=1 Tax=Streptomyces griseus TaxID=1911 RepID=UPI000564B2C3|nr:ester cyclase [Streptomyces griseus]
MPWVPARPGTHAPDLAQAFTDHLGRRVSYEPLARGVRPPARPPPRPFGPERVQARLAEDFHDHNHPAGFGDEAGDRDVLVMLLTALATAFPDGRHTIERLTPVGTDEALLYRRFSGTAFLGAVTAGARVDFAGTGLFAAGSGAFTAQRHVEDLFTLTSRTAPGPRRIMTVASTPDSKRRPHRGRRCGRRCRGEVPSSDGDAGMTRIRRRRGFR